MFDNVQIEYDDKKYTYTIKGFFGTGFKRTIEKNYIGKKKLLQLFININHLEIKFYDFFILEIYHMFKDMVESGSIYSVKLRTISNAIRTIEDEIFDTTLSCRHELDYNKMKNDIKFEMLEHQKIAFERYEDVRCRFGYRGMLLDAAVGSGKTFMSLSLSSCLNAHTILIIAPLPTLEKVWIKSIAGTENDAEMVFNTQQEYWISTSDKPYNGEKYIITHYEYLPKLDHILMTLNKDETTVIVDEVHNFNSPTSKRTKELTSLVNDLDPHNVILLSGTPIKSAGSEMSTIFKLIDKRFNKYVEKRFLKIYKSPSSFFKTILPIKYGEYSVKIKKENLSLKPVVTKYLKIKLKNYKPYLLINIVSKMKEYISNRHKEVTSDMEKYVKTYNTLYNKAKKYHLNNKTDFVLKDFTKYEEDFKTVIKHYKKKTLLFIPDCMKRVNVFEKDCIMSVLDSKEKKDFKEAKTILKYLYLKLQGEALANVVMQSRIDCYSELASEGLNFPSILESSTKKTIVFSNYINVCKAVDTKVKKLKYKPVNVYGETARNLSTEVGRFTSDETLNPLITTYKSLSTGVPIIIANIALFLGLPPRSYIYEQALGRVWRTGQDKTVYAYITELDTSDEYNITNRDIDIIKYFRDQVEEATGYASDVSLAGDEIEHTLSIENYNDIFIDENIIERINKYKVKNDFIDTWSNYV